MHIVAVKTSKKGVAPERRVGAALYGGCMGLQNELAEWAKSALHPHANHLGKLREELTELELAPADPMEIGDVMLALMLHADAHGVDALLAAQEKFEIVRGRKYGEPDANSIQRHLPPNE